MLAATASRWVLLRNVLLSTVAVAAVSAAPALAKHSTGKGSHGAKKTNLNAVYTETNNPSGNALLVFRRNGNGSLSNEPVQTVLTGGKGANMQPPFGFPVVDSAGSVQLSKDGHWVFAVNGGPSFGSDGSVSSFKVTSSGLKLVSNVSSGGQLPISVTVNGNLVYVLNEGTGDISGLRLSPSGKLKLISGSRRALSTQGNVHANGAPAQIKFSPGGRVLNVTERATNTIDTFKMHSNGKPGPAIQTTTPAGANNPFGFAYQHGNHLIVTNADASDPNPAQMFMNASVSSYLLKVNSSKPLSPITPNLLSGGAASCWVVLTDNQRYAFVSNTVSGAGQDVAHDISIFRIADNGALTLIGHAGPTGNTGFTSDLDLSSGGKYLYVLQPSNVTNPLTTMQAAAANTSHINEFKVGAGGTLTYLGSTNADQPNSLSGLQAW